VHRNVNVTFTATTDKWSLHAAPFWQATPVQNARPAISAVRWSIPRWTTSDIPGKAIVSLVAKVPIGFVATHWSPGSILRARAGR